MPEIHVLPTYLVNKIAAGEVIERPASVIKELIENAIDADASRIDIAIEDGGRRLLSVSDDGCGMASEDLALAFSPHATSKLTDEEDLFAIGTMGFRGEALASIASISHAHIRTRRREETGGHEISAAGDNVDEVRPCAASPGTTVTIRDLFFNTPARRKFMRTANTEYGHITEQLARLALPHPHIAFTLTHNGRTTQNLPATDATARRVADLFGEEMGRSLLRLSPRHGDVEIDGLIAPPAAARGSGKWQYFFLNGRYVRDRLLAHALREAYRGLVDPSRYPVAFIFLRLDPQDVDVNVHPTKVEVRFRDGQRVHGELLAALKETLNRSDLAPGVALGASESGAAPPIEPEGNDARRESLREALADFFKSVPPNQPRFNFGESLRSSMSTKASVNLAPRAYDSPTGDSSPAGFAKEAPATAQQHAPEAPSSELQFQAVQLHHAYIVAAVEDGLVIVDQHALHERLIYNDLHQRLLSADASLESQRLLIPETLKVSDTEAATLEEVADILHRLGMEVAAFGPGTVAIQRFPTLLIQRGAGGAEFLRDLLDQLGDQETSQPERLLEKVLSMMACKAAVKAGDPLTAAEIDSLLARRQDAEKHSACPHGRPTTLRLTLKDLEKQFKRA